MAFFMRQRKIEMISHKTVAKQLGIEEQSVLNLIDKYIDDFTESGKINFVKIPTGNNRIKREAILDERAYYMLIMCSKNTSKSRKLKMKIVIEGFENGIIKNPLFH